jgi:hypothetical protein
MKGKSSERNIDPTTANGIVELQAHVQRRLRGRVYDFRLIVTDQGLLLGGRVRTYYVKQLAQHAVMEVTAFPVLANEIEVF